MHGLVRILISKWLAVYMGGGTGHFPGRGVKRNLAMHVYISYFFSSIYMERIFLGRFSSHSCKAGSQQKSAQFLAYKHTVPLCRDDIILSLEIVPGEIVHVRNILI